MTTAFLLLSISAFAQPALNKCRWILADGQPTVLDSLSVLPTSILIESQGNSPDYFYDLNSGTISISSPEKDSLLVCYRTMPFSFHSTIFKRSLNEYDSNAMFKDIPIQKNQHQELFKTDNIEKSGSIVRGISAGNNQDVVVNSTMDIALQGKLNEYLNIRAQITDQNIPYQPEGTTQYVQDIDQIFIQLYNENLALTAGDITLKNSEEGFLRYNKRVQGGHFENKFNMGGGINASVSVAASVAKGKFASTVIEVTEGISGPYKIKAPTGEKFIFIVANTERAYLDGRLLERGFDNDYIIDYNQSEITFTARTIITRYSRVTIDYEFADKNYSRSIIAANHKQESERHNFYLNFYREKDNKNQPLSLNLTDVDKAIMELAGDETQMLYSTSYDSVGYNENEILYEKLLINGQDIFRFSTHPDSGRYRVRFMEVGTGKGNYIKQKLVGNGWIYQWVEPVNSMPQGNYEPVSLLVAPTQRSMATAGGVYRFNGHEEIFAEMAFSNHDQNLFSKFDADDNKGIAYKVGFRSSNRPLGNFQFNSQFDVESLGKHFTAIDRYKPIEYERYWNPGNSLVAAGEDITLDFKTSVKNDDGDFFQYAGTKRKMSSNFDGVQHALGTAKNFGRLLLDGDYLYALSKNPLNDSKWDRMHLGAYYFTPIVVPGYSYRFEKNTIGKTSTDSIIGSSGYFYEHMFHIKSHDTLKTVLGINYGIRTDLAPEQGELQKQHRGQTLAVHVKTPTHRDHFIQSIFSYRKTNQLGAISLDDNGENIAGSLNYSGRLWKSMLSPEISYGINNGREQKREYIFIQVPTGQGHYTWIDDNDDGIQDLSEFYEARYEDEKNYAKIFVPTDEYIAAFSNDLNARLKYEPLVNWRNKKGIMKTFSRISGYSALIYSKKIVDDNLWQRLSPFLGEDTPNVLSFRNSRRLQVFYNRIDPVYGLEFNLQQAKRRQVLTNGFEETFRKNSMLTIRINIWEGAIFRLNAGKGHSTSGSDYLSNRNFEIRQQELMPEMEWLLGRRFRMTGKMSWMGKKSEEQERDGRADFRTIDMGINGNAANGMIVGLNLCYTKIDYDKPANSFLEYEMLEALRPGNNFTWQFRVQQDLLQGLQLSVNYNGRRTESSKAIHFGRVQLMAYF